MKPAAQTYSDGKSDGRSDPERPDPNRGPGAKFVEETIRALIDLDAEHLEALAAAAEQFRQEAMARMTHVEVLEMETKMRLLSSLLAETRRNLRIFASAVGRPDPFGYKPGRRLWVD